ncbi:maintenance of mitochondrial morphology protein 1 [Russula emetica]|nr:maintenance of mitochondrial morphology protein 1 [Russula emetica]
MGSGYIFSLQPTFTQGFILGQFSILALLFVVLKYLFLDTEPAQNVPERVPVSQPAHPSTRLDEKSTHVEPESTEWLNCSPSPDVYRSKLRDDLQGVEGDEVLRRRVEDFVNIMRPSGILDRIQVHSVNLGVAAPHISNTRSRLVAGLGSLERSEFEVTYKDNVSISLSTAYLFNYPMIGFARMPISVTISLSVFSCRAVITPPPLSSPVPAFTLTMLPNFTLDLKSTSLLGSRAKLADVPKLHELIDNQLRRALSRRGTFKLVLPGFSNIEDVKRPERQFVPTFKN